MTFPGHGSAKAPKRSIWTTLLLIAMALAIYYANQKGWLGQKSPPIGSSQPPAPKVDAPSGPFRPESSPTNRTPAIPPTHSSPTRQPGNSSTRAPTQTSPTQNLPSRQVLDDGGIKKLYDAQKSYQIVTGSGRVVHILPDDLETGDGTGQHQKFLVELNTGITIRLVNNLEFSRVPVAKGDFVKFRGEYIYNEKGGTVHWTHHDPRGRHADGWIEHDGKKYD